MSCFMFFIECEWESMEYQENMLCYKDYCRLRKSVGWLSYSEEQVREFLKRNLYTVVAIDKNCAIAMGRLIGDGMYHMIVDVVVRPEYQKRGIGTHIVKMLAGYVEDRVPTGGRASIFLAAENGKEGFYERMGFKRIPHEYCGSGMRKGIQK